MQIGLFSNTVGAAQVAPVVQAADSTNIFDSAVLLSLSLGVFGTSRKLSNSEFDVDASRDKVGASKKLLKSDELKAIVKFDGETRRLVNNYTLPSQFRAGLYLLPIACLEKMDSILQERIAERQVLVDEFLSRYENIKWQDSLSADQGGLGAIYHAQDYPAIDEVRASFKMAYTYTEFSAPGKLSSISMAIYQRCEAETREIWRNAAEEGRALLRGVFAGLIDHMHDRLMPGSDGKAKIFRDSLLGNVVEFLESFDARNLAGDAELKALVDEVSGMLSGVSPKDLRENETIKAHVSAQVESIKVKLDTMVADKPARRINFDSVDSL
jgi:hypothetical protein